MDHRQPCRIVVLISGSGSNLQALIDASADGSLNASIVAVISNVSDAYGLERARESAIDTHVLDHRDFSSRESYDKELRRLASSCSPDLIILAGFMRILSACFVSGFENRIMNIHPSLLPLYPGLHTHQRALDAGDKRHGCSVHFVTTELDAGPIVIQGQVPILGDDDADSLRQRIHRVEHTIYPRAANWFANGRLRVENERVLLDGEANGKRLVVFDDMGNEIDSSGL